MQTEVDAATNKVPFIGDLPFIGVAFRRVQYEEREQELIILVTPRLVGGLWPHQRPTCFPGLETRRPTDFELFLEGILEAPPGPRPLKPDGCYRPAHWQLGTADFCEPHHARPEPSLPPPSPLTPNSAESKSMRQSQNRITAPDKLPEIPALSGSTPEAARDAQPSPITRISGPTETPSEPVVPAQLAPPSKLRSSPPVQAEAVAVEPVPSAPAGATLGTPVRRPLYRPLRDD